MHFVKRRGWRHDETRSLAVRGARSWFRGFVQWTVKLILAVLHGCLVLFQLSFDAYTFRSALHPVFLAAGAHKVHYSSDELPARPNVHGGRRDEVISSQLGRRRESKYQKPRSPLLLRKFWRIVMDEAQVTRERAQPRPCLWKSFILSCPVKVPTSTCLASSSAR
eukprot:5987446-Pleurochrysis_carterae.AAC.1